MAETTTLLGGGKMKLRQTRKVSGTSGNINYEIVSTVSEAHDFPEVIRNLRPECAFVKINTEYVRIANTADLTDVPPLVPTEVGGEYRATSITRSFSDPEQAVAWSSYVHRTLGSLHIKLKDYAAVLNDAAEEVWIPTTSSQDIYDRIVEYQGIDTQWKIKQTELAVLRARRETAESIMDMATLLPPLVPPPVEVGVLPTPQPAPKELTTIKNLLLVLPTTLTFTKIKLEASVGIGSFAPATIPDVITTAKTKLMPDATIAITQQSQAITATVQARAANEAAIEATNDLISAAESSSGWSAPTGWAATKEALYSRLRAIRTHVGTVNQEIAGIGVTVARIANTMPSLLETLMGYQGNMLGSAGALGQAADNIVQAIVSANTVAALVTQMNTLGEVKRDAIVELLIELEGMIKTAEDEAEALLRYKQDMVAELTNLLGDEFDPDNPLSFFNHRIFRTLV